ncbi:SUZ RNA-binding domain-containing isoform X2 [Pseudochaenichthys georgianus]|uniref:SUZ RNA-binding domain-containing isoform X2 n=1 Tax=Pseudochaenichthys georgianus TaxID=52239 RepID=UPI0039C43601
MEMEKRLEEKLRISQKEKETSNNSLRSPLKTTMVIQDDSLPAAPPPQIRILKRPTSNGSFGSPSNQNRPTPQVKSLAQREAEYAEARKRILGSTCPEETPQDKPNTDKLLPPTPAGGEQIAGHLPSSSTWLTFLITNAYVLWTSIEPSWQQQKPYRRRLFIEEVGEMLVTPPIKKRGRLPRSSAAATIVSDLQGAAAGPSLISERKSRRQCHFAWTEEFAAPARPELDSHSQTQCSSFNVHLCKINIFLVQNYLVLLILAHNRVIGI